MRFFIDEVEVFFPYSYIYPEQYQYMCKLKQVLDAKGPGVLEMPSGTGKTVTLLSLITSYQLVHPEVGKLVYCSRTVSEIEKALEEAKVVKAYRDKELGVKAPNPSLWLGLSSRRNTCIHPRVSEEKDGVVVDAKCRNMTANYVRERASVDNTVELCDYFEGFEKWGKDIHLNGVYTLEDLKSFGQTRTVCPYFLARHSVQFADVLVFSYQYVIDPKISDMVTKEVKNCILVFDEAHNIDNVCIDALSININRYILEASQRNINKLQTQISEIRRIDADRLRREYLRLVEGLAQDNRGRGIADQLRADPTLPNDVVQEVVPGNIRKGEHFLALLKRLLEFIKTRMRVSQVVSENPLLFLQRLMKTTQIDAKTLRFCSSRLGSLLYTLEMTDLDQFTPLSLLCDFATLVGTYSKGFLLIIEPNDDRSNLTGDSLLQFSCLDASLAIQPVLRKYRSVIITSGTISPLDIYPRILNFKPVAVERFPMSLTRNCVCPLIVSRGSDQVVISSRFDIRNDPAVVRNFGNLLVEMSAAVPDGIVCFFTSYGYMEEIVSYWNEMGLLNTVLQNKLLFVETPDPAETALALENYKKACNSGRGAVLFSVARGKVSEGIDFNNQYGRCVILFGIPYVNTESRILKARLEFLRDNYQIRENEFLTFDAMRTASQCVGRVIRGKTDYGIMIFADKRYNRMDKRGKLPQWISESLTGGNLNLSTDMAVSISKKFLKEMAQPWTKDEQLGKSLWTLDHVLKYQNANKSTQ